MSFAQDKIASEGLTFDDVLLLPAFSEVLPREVSIKSQFSRKIELNTPIVSAAMDTVTEEKLAITIAREGGIGVIHKNMPLEEQTRQVKRVKRAESVMIHEPITILKEGTVGDALNLRSRLVTIPMSTLFLSTTGIPPILYSLISFNASPTVHSFKMVMGS